MSDSAAAALHAPTDDLAMRAVALTRRWVDIAAADQPDPAARRLADVLHDPHGLEFAVGVVDGVMRPESSMAAAARLQRVAPLVPEFLPWYLRGAVRVGGAIAPVLPVPTVPIARRLLRDVVSPLVIDARSDKLGAALAGIRHSGVDIDVALLGEAVLGDAEARRRLEGIHDLVRRDDVDRVSITVSAVAGRTIPWAFDDTVAEVVERLRPLALTAADNGTAATLDAAQYRDLDVTVAVFTRLLEEPALGGLRAGITLPTAFPDTLPILQDLTARAQRRVDDGGAPITIRLVTGANLRMEWVDAVLHGWPLAPYDTRADIDANYVRCVRELAQPGHAGAVQVVIASHNLFDVAYAWVLASERGLADRVEIEMPLGVAQGQLRAVAGDVGTVCLAVPAAHPEEFDAAAVSLVRRLEEGASSENVLASAFGLAADPALFARESDRFAAALARADDPALPVGSRRTQDRTVTAPLVAPPRPTPHPPADATEEPAETQPMEPDTPPELFGGVPFVETAVFARQERGTHAGGAPGFRNAADSDPALPAGRQWAGEVFTAAGESTAGEVAIAAARIHNPAALDERIRRVRAAAESWGATPAADRAAVLRATARALETRRGLLIEVAMSETGKVFGEADTEASEAVDLAAYYGATARELDRVSGAVFVPARLTVVAPPWNFPLAGAAGGALAALAAGSGVVLTPARQARRSAAVIAETMWSVLHAEGLPRDLVALVDLDEDTLAQHLIAHPDVDRVLLTGSRRTAERFRSWRPDLPLVAETGGKNAMVITPSADLDLAVADLVRSAFGYAGQKRSATSLAILVGPVARSARFRRQLIDAVTSLRVGAATDPRTEVGPLIAAPDGDLEWALTTLEAGERWLVEPQRVDGDRLWRPGVRAGVQAGSRTHLEEFFGPMLGVMNATTLGHAIELQNAAPHGMTAGLHTQNPDDLARWLDEVEAGNLYVNRATTGAIVQRQPFGGWKRSSIGTGTKPGGPHYLVGLGSWRPTVGGAPSSALHLRGLDTRIATVIEAAQPTLDYPSFDLLRRGAMSDAQVWEREFGQVRDVSRLGVVRNLLRYRPVPVGIRATADAAWRDLLRVVVAGVRAGARFTLSSPVGLPAEVRHALADLDVPVWVESDAEWLHRLTGEPGDSAGPGDSGDPGDSAGPVAATGADDGVPEERAEADPPAERGPHPARVRLVGSAQAVADLRARVAEATMGDPDVAVYDTPVTTAGRIELLPFLHEQSVTITAHRLGAPDDWSTDVI
ncbi:proline dehydrogenase family protein [Microbacterium sp.]|uniref:proline dehydrogenase family protein n=1 Tax=Microbacterium sp. TaxID=51671 RepID=UPI003A8B1505